MAIDIVATNSLECVVYTDVKNGVYSLRNFQMCCNSKLNVTFRHHCMYESLFRWEFGLALDMLMN